MNIFKYLALRLAPYFAFFVVLEFCVRIALSLYSAADIHGMGPAVPMAFGVGLMFDIGVFFYLSIPVMFYALCLPANLQGTRKDRIFSTGLFFVFAYVLIFCATGEWFFWDEFQSRYNFIAVDYLVYTHEVIGNIQESYPVPLLMSIMAVIVFALCVAFYKVAPRFLPFAVSLGRRSCAFILICLLATGSFFVLKGSYAEISQNRYVDELARNGIFELFSAYRNNNLDYSKFYETRPMEDVAKLLQQKLEAKGNEGSPLLRHIDNKGKKKNYNLVLITVESLSAEYLAEFGSEMDITPNLDKLIPQSLFFSNLYATGTRTVYGLSSITLAMPPIPGNSIVRRPHNDNLFSLGHVLKSKGYDTKFIYGGFGYFDNMNAFFGNNGYEVVDRNNLAKDEVTFANVWGVADGDLFNRVLKENDKAHESGKPFFDMIMTTSNHRPYTYPEGKIDLPSKSGRRGGVKYTDFAINEFLENAKKHAWFNDTIFVIIADHTAGSSGKNDLDPDKYHIPLWIYAPSIIKPAKIDAMASQIDFAPTILGLMGVDYDSLFYGVDLMKQKPKRAFISNYQKLGYMTEKGLIILKPVREIEFYQKDKDGQYVLQKDVPADLLDEAIGYYQGASQWQTWSSQKALSP